MVPTVYTGGRPSHKQPVLALVPLLADRAELGQAARGAGG
jgi:hypothetical protein